MHDRVSISEAPAGDEFTFEQYHRGGSDYGHPDHPDRNSNSRINSSSNNNNRSSTERGNYSSNYDKNTQFAQEGTNVFWIVHVISFLHYSTTTSDPTITDSSSNSFNTNNNNTTIAEDSEFVKKLKMDAILKLITLSSVAGALLLVLCYWWNSRAAFLTLVTFGVGILFFCTPAINMGFMLAVPTGE
jgi:hypothetical protein